MVKFDVFQHYNITFDNYDKVYIPNVSMYNKQRKKHSAPVSVVYGAFDTETSHTIYNKGKGKECKCWVNSWQFALVYNNKIYSYQGRDIRTFALFIGGILNRDYNKRLKVRVWIHNADYDIEYIFQTLKMYYEVDIFVKKPHDYLYMLVKGQGVDIEFLDSFSLMPKSLGKLCNDYDVYHKKKDTYDYQKTIFSDTPLTDEEITYDMYDVYALCEIIQGYMDNHPLFNTTDTIPYTMTGQVRKYIELEFKKNEKQNRYIMYDYEPTFEEYKMIKEAYTGGITRVNTIYANQLIYVPNGEIIHADIKSSYPYAILGDECIYPLSSGVFFNPDNVTTDMLKNDIYIMKVAIKGIQARHGFPNLSYSKCICTGEFCDNGKIIRSDVVITTITSVDFKILNYCYDYEDLKIIEFLHYDRVGQMPEWIRNVTLKFFQDKEQTDKSDGLNYLISKELLNAIYGCLSSDILHSESYLDDDINDLRVEEITEDKAQTTIHKHYGQKYLPYLPCWVTSYARYNLFRGISYTENTVKGATIYTDTDSLFIKAENKQEAQSITNALLKLNDKISQKSVSVVNYKGKVSTLGIWEFEDKGKYHSIVGIHAKAYALGVDDEHIDTMTLAGVTAKNKKTGVTREQECDTFDKFMGIDSKGKGFIFRECGGTTCAHLYDTPHIENIDGHMQWCASGGIILDTVKQISFKEGENFICCELLNNSYLSKDKISIEELNT